MFNLLKICGMLFLLSPALFGQIELSYSIQKTIVGATNAEVLNSGRILVGEDSKISESLVAVIKVVSTDGFRIKAWKGLRETAELDKLNDVVDDSTKKLTSRYLLAGQGTYVIDIVSRTNEDWDRSVEITIGASPGPKPEPPKPDPKPEPPEPPKPDVDIPNEYNVGLVSYTTAPKDYDNAAIIAKWYRVGATKLYGQSGLHDIATVLNQIDEQFRVKQCKDRVTCEQWEKWKVAVSAALIKEQSKRKTFTRQDWFSALVEIATSLEKVK